MGIDPQRLFSYNLRQFLAIVKGFRREKAMQESYYRNIYAVLVMANRDPKKPAPVITNYWPIPILDEAMTADIEETENNTDIKAKLLRAWRLN